MSSITTVTQPFTYQVTDQWNGLPSWFNLRHAVYTGIKRVVFWGPVKKSRYNITLNEEIQYNLKVTDIPNKKCLNKVLKIGTVLKMYITTNMKVSKSRYI